MIDAAYTLIADDSRSSDRSQFPLRRRPYAAWAQTPRRRGFSFGALCTGAIMRMQPVLVLNLAVALLVASGLGMFALATYALTAQG
jgi:hypothetical protein